MSRRSSRRNRGVPMQQFYPPAPVGAHPNAEIIQTRESADADPWSPKRFLAEFFGTFFLVMFIVGVRGNTGQLERGLPTVNDAPVGGLVGVALVHTFALVSMAAAFGSTSGAHLNPAVTFTFMITREIEVVIGVLYIIVQCLAGILGAFMAHGIVGQVYWAAPLKCFSCTVFQSFLAEFVGTAFLLFTIMMAGVSAFASHAAYLAIGIALGTGVLFAGPVSNACLNPARALGAAVVSTLFDKYDFLGPDNFFVVYVIAPFVASILVGLTWGLVFQTPEDASKGPTIQWWRN